ncbi:integrase [Marivivens marinus]|uniref:integrase n=1 Tax=Marivivens marinus TaxID=3110173 RepID=UPI003B847649
MTLIQRGKSKTFHLLRRVPTRYAEVDSREKVCISLHTDSRREAETRAAGAWSGLIESWELRLRGRSNDAEESYKAAKEIARSKGFRFMPVKEVAELPIDEIIDRVLATIGPNGKPSIEISKGTLGTARAPEITVSRALKAFWDLAADRTLGKNTDQIRRWENPRKKAVANFIKAVGDIRIDHISADDMLDWKEWWLDRVRSGEVTAGTANKDFVYFGDIMETVNQGKRLGLALPVRGWNIRNREDRPERPAFSTDWIKEKLLAPDALAGLNPDARGLVIGMINTGYRPSEGACLTSAQIRLDVNIPYISIEPVGRTLKTKQAKRKIPLLGVSLEIFREFPNGFERYHKSGNVSNTINKYLTENGLRETPAHSLYSLRHSFQERMIAARVDDRIRRELFGHRLTEEKYGDPGLDVKRDQLRAAAIY